MSEWFRARAWFAWSMFAGALLLDLLLNAGVSHVLAAVAGGVAVVIVALVVGEPR